MNKKDSNFLSTFTQECVELGDLEVTWACHKIYGQWPLISSPGHMEFYPKDYQRYSLKARQEVVTAAMAVEDEYNTLRNIYMGFACDKEFFKELDLWKQWCGEAFVAKALSDYLASEVGYKWQNFEATMDYAEKQLTSDQAQDWLKKLDETPHLNSKQRNSIEKCIKKHTIA